MIDLIVNGRAVATAAKTVSDLVAMQDFAGARIATAVNGDFVPEGRRATTPLNPGDQVEIVTPRQGG
jgi:sulfur carrier protein